MSINFVLRLDVMFTISTFCKLNMSNCEHCFERNKVTKHKLQGVSLQHACCSLKNVIQNKNNKPHELGTLSLKVPVYRALNGSSSLDFNTWRICLIEY